jgi:16S rRNA U1498 N3-methylase RsmE
MRRRSQIVAIERDRVLCKASAAAQVLLASPALHLVLGLPKGGKAEEIVRMLSERGGDSSGSLRVRRHPLAAGL